MSPASRLAALLAAGLALAACASSPSKDGEVGAPDPEAADAPGGRGEDGLPGKGKAGFYLRIHSMTSAWVAANAEPGAAASMEARALEPAIAREVLAKFDQVLEDLRSSDNPRWRTSAARGLGFVANGKVRPALEGVLADLDADVLAAALVSLARIADPETDDREVVKLLTYPDKVVQGGAALCLARVFQSRRQQSLAVLSPSPRVLQVEVDLMTLLFDREDPILRGNAAQALGALGSPFGEDALLNRVRDDHNFVRLKVAQALGMSGSTKCYDVLLDSLGREQEKNVQVVTALALGAIAERDGQSPPLAELKTDAGAWRKWLKK